MNELEQKFLEHTAAGTQWAKHKYLYITPSGRYVYPGDYKNPGTKYGSKEYEEQNAKRGGTINTRKAFTTSKPATTTSKSTTKTSSSSAVNKTNQAAAQISVKSSNTGQYKKLSDEAKKVLTAAQDKEAAKKKKEEEKAAKQAEKEKKAAEKAAKQTASTAKKTTVSKEAQDLNLSEEDLKELMNTFDPNATSREDVINGVALKVIRGDFGNGNERKEKLGRFYGVIQSRVNELMKTMKGKNQSKKNTSKKVKKSSSKTSSKAVKYGSAEYEKQKKGTTINNRKTIQHSNEEEFLMHFGIKKKSGRYPFGSGERPYQHDPAARRKYVKKSSFKKRRTMSDAELEDRINRLRKEKELVQLENNDTMTKGEKFVYDIMYDVGKKALTIAATGALLYAGKSFVSGEFNKKELGDAMFKGGSGKNK